MCAWDVICLPKRKKKKELYERTMYACAATSIQTALEY